MVFRQLEENIAPANFAVKGGKKIFPGPGRLLLFEKQRLLEDL